MYNIDSLLQQTTLQHTKPIVSKKAIIYARVSSTKQKKAGDLQRQIESLQTSYPNHQLISDVGSGINFKRQGLQKLLFMVLEGKVREIVVEHRDRLCRFGFDLIEWLCERHGTKITVESEVDTTPEQDFTNDLMAVIAVFSARYNGRRRYKRKQSNSESEGENETDKRTESGAEEVVGDKQTPIQPSPQLGQKRRKKTRTKLSQVEKPTSDKEKRPKRRRMDE